MPTSVRLTAAILLRPCMKDVEQDLQVGIEAQFTSNWT
jgi:hypothetical protein